MGGGAEHEDDQETLGISVSLCGVSIGRLPTPFN